MIAAPGLRKAILKGKMKNYERSSCKVERLAMKRFLFHYLASHFLADRNSTTTNKEEKEQEI